MGPAGERRIRTTNLVGRMEIDFSYRVVVLMGKPGTSGVIITLHHLNIKKDEFSVGHSKLVAPFLK